MVRIKALHNLKKKSLGFTLMEVTIAVVILSSALVTLLGLQSSILKRALRDEEKQQAMLVARTILSAIEVRNKDIEVQDGVSTVQQLLGKLQLDISDKENDKSIQKFEFMARLKVENVGLKNIGDNLLKSVSLSIYSKQAPEVNGFVQDSFDVTYLIPQEDEEEVP